MHENNRTTAIAREWIIKAENDLKTAAHTLKMVRGCPTDIVCFHAQQCVEKYLKAFLVIKEAIQFSAPAQGSGHDASRINVSENLNRMSDNLIAYMLYLHFASSAFCKHMLSGCFVERIF
jgi:hypothetical protein